MQFQHVLHSEAVVVEKALHRMEKKQVLHNNAEVAGATLQYRIRRRYTVMQ
jgi:hypothetical protein